MALVSMAVSAGADMLIPPVRVGSSDWGANESVNQLFSWEAPVLGQPDPGYFIDTGGYAWDSGGEVNLIAWMDFGAEYAFTALDFATQSGSDGFNRVKLWISNSLSAFTVVNGSTPPAGEPDLNVTCGANGANFAQYALSTVVTARYVVAQFLSERVSDTSRFHPRAWELRMEGTGVTSPAQQPSLADPLSLNATNFAFTLMGDTNRTYRIESSVDLPSSNWTVMGRLTTSTPATPVLVPVAAEEAHRFFRVIME